MILPMIVQIIVAILTLAGLLILHGFFANGFACWVYIFMGIRYGISPSEEDIQGAKEYIKARPGKFLKAMFGL